MTQQQKNAITAYRKLNDKGIPLEYYQDMGLPENESQIDAFAKEVETKYRITNPSVEDIKKVLENILP